MKSEEQQNLHLPEPLEVLAAAETKIVTQTVRLLHLILWGRGRLFGLFGNPALEIANALTETFCQRWQPASSKENENNQEQDEHLLHTKTYQEEC